METVKTLMLHVTVNYVVKHWKWFILHVDGYVITMIVYESTRNIDGIPRVMIGCVMNTPTQHVNHPLY